MEIQDADLDLRQALGLTEGRGGIMIRDITPGGPADLAGFFRGDMLIGFEGVRIENLRQVVAYMQSTKPGQRLRFEVWNDGSRREQAITLGDWPPGWRVKTSALAVVPRLGINLAALTPEVRQSAGLRWGRTGVLLRSLEENSPALAYGLEAGDLLVAVGRTPVTDPAVVDGLLAAMGEHWYLLIERDNQVALVGPDVGTLLSDLALKGDIPQAAPVVVGEHLLAANLPDGPYVMDRDVATGAALAPGARLESMPPPRVWAQDQETILDGAGMTVATLTQARQQKMRLHWSSRGMVVIHVKANSPAQRAGLAPGHVITAVNGNTDPTSGEFVAFLKANRGDVAVPVALLVFARNGYFLTSVSPRPVTNTAVPMLDVLRQFSQPEK
jgi:S1-C subfamily serine protease